jgi:hypothetical protein
MINDEEDVVPNFAGTGETAIIPRYRNVKDIPRMAKGYVPNFSNASGSFGTVSKINESQVRKAFFSGAGQSGAGEIANEFLASRKLSEQIQASRELGYQGMRGGYIGKLFEAPHTYGTLEDSIRSGSIVKGLAPGKTAKDIGDNLDKYTGEYKNYYELVTNLGRLSAKQINSGKTMEARDLANFGNLMLNKKAEDLITKIVSRKGSDRLVGKMNSSWQSTSRVAEALARQGARINIVDPGIFGGLGEKRKKELGKLGYQDNYREMTGVNAAGYIPNFAKKDKYKFPNISSNKMEANIGKNFEKLTPENQRYFARAYEDYNNLIKVFSKASGTSPEKFANVMSALSPANPLERNALDALRYNLFYQKKLSTAASPIFIDEREIGSVKAQTYGANRTKAANLLVGLEKLTGNKRKSFVNNMLDPFQSTDVTVDYRAQGGTLNKQFNVKNAPSMNRKQYDKVSQAFRNVGSKAGVSGLGVQAATWIGGRIGSKAARGQDFNRGILKFFYDNPDKISLENLEFLLSVPRKGKARKDFFKNASAMGVSKLGSDSLISIPRAGGYVPNFADAGFNLSTIRFLMKASSKMSGSVLSPKTLIKFAAGKGKVEDLVNPFLDFLKKPADVINSRQDLDDAKSIVNIIFKNNKAREMAASRLAPILNESSFSVQSQNEAISTGIKYEGSSYRDYRDFLRYRLLGGQKEYNDYVGNEYAPSTLIKNKDGSYRFNSKSVQGKNELSDIGRAATAIFSAPEEIEKSRAMMVQRETQRMYQARKLGPEDNIPGSNPFLGYTYKLGRFIGNAGKRFAGNAAKRGGAVGYQDRWDVDLNQGEERVLKDFLKNDSGVSDLETRKQIANFYIDRDLSAGSYGGDINSLIAKDLMASIPGAKPVLLKGVARVQGDGKIRAEGYIPNFSGLSDAVSREKTALAQRGVPASQIMAHFDGGGNPIAVTNKIDEPNGLKDVVPNFAPRVKPPKAPRGKKGATADQVSDLFSSFFSQSIGIGFFQSLSSTLADREVLSEDVNAATQVGAPALLAILQVMRGLKASKGQKKGARIAASGVPLALGGAQAAMGFFASKSVGEDLQRRKLEKESDKAAKEFKDLTEGTQELADTLSKLNESFKDATSSPEQLFNLSKRASELTRNITKNNPALAAAISSEPNIEKKINLIEDARRKASQQQAVKQEIIQFEGSKTKSPEDLINLFSKEISLANDKLLQLNRKI